MLNHDSHVSDELLLMEMEGELASREASAVRAHLNACWRCRARRQELERSITGFIEAYQQEFDPQLPPAAGPRALLKARLEQGAAPDRNRRTTLPVSGRRLAWTAAACVFSLLIIGWIATRLAWREGIQTAGTNGSGTVDGLAPSIPNAALTPGATILLSRSAVCSQENVKNKDVPPSVRRRVFEEYGLVNAQARAYEVDYLVTPALGGSDDIRNLWPHSYSSLWNARVKDALEDRLREMVCSGRLDLTEAQREIAGNWIDAYKKYFHTDRPLPEHTNR